MIGKLQVTKLQSFRAKLKKSTKEDNIRDA